jgi:hypothetical protein
MDTKSKQPLVDKVLGLCVPNCPFLDHANESCTQTGKKLEWYDYWLAECLEDSKSGDE